MPIRSILAKYLEQVAANAIDNGAASVGQPSGSGSRERQASPAYNSSSTLRLGTANDFWTQFLQGYNEAPYGQSATQQVSGVGYDTETSSSRTQPQQQSASSHTRDDHASPAYDSRSQKPTPTQQTRSRQDILINPPSRSPSPAAQRYVPTAPTIGDSPLSDLDRALVGKYQGTKSEGSSSSYANARSIRDWSLRLYGDGSYVLSTACLTSASAAFASQSYKNTENESGTWCTKQGQSGRILVLTDTDDMFRSCPYFNNSSDRSRYDFVIELGKTYLRYHGPP